MNNAPFVIDSVFISLSLIKGAYHREYSGRFFYFGGNTAQFVCGAAPWGRTNKGGGPAGRPQSIYQQ